MEDIKAIKKRADAAKSYFDSQWLPAQKEKSLYIMPNRGRFDESAGDRGKKRYSYVIDATATVAAQRFAAGLSDGLTPISREWLKAETSDKDLMEAGEVKLWLTFTNRETKRRLRAHGVYKAFYSAYIEYIVFGICAIYEERDVFGRAWYKTFTAGEYYVEEDKRGKVSHFYRRFEMTADNMVSKFGEENVSSKVKTLVNSKRGFTLVKAWHAIIPNPDYDETRLDNKSKKFTSVYYEAGNGAENHVLSESGYDKFPVSIARHDVVSSDIYSSSPCDAVLGVVKSLQEESKDGMRAGKMAIAPMLNVPTTLANVPLGAGAKFLYDASMGPAQVTPVYQVNYNFSANIEGKRELRDLINKLLNGDLFAAISSLDRRNMTATEVSQRISEASKMLTHLISQLEVELLTPIVENELEYMLENGILPEPPDLLAGEDITLVFVSPMALAQRSTGITAIEQVLGVVRELAQLDPSAVIKLNSHQTIDEVGRMSGAEMSMIRTDEEVQEIQDAQAKQAEEERTAAMLSQMADGAQKLGNSPLGQGSVLDKVMEGVDGNG